MLGGSVTALDSRAVPNQSLQPTGAAILVSRDTQPLQAAPPLLSCVVRQTGQ
jgi:hypothetical protein